METVKIMFCTYSFVTICPSTIYRWLVVLGFKYQTRRKGYYVDGHERPATVTYRKIFVTRYLNYEMRMHRWIQIPLSESTEMVESGKLIKDSGYKYVDGTGIEMVEYHVDTLDDFQIRMNKTKYGGNLSIRKDPNDKPLIIFGHDECIFKQYLLTKKSWFGPDGELALVPKDEGQGVMISALQSREFGFGMCLTEEEQKKINDKRKGEKYKDKDAAKKRNGSSF